MAVSSQIETSVHIERHYAVTEIAEMWNLSADKVRDLFEREPGVLVLEKRIHATKGVTLLCAFLKRWWNGSTLGCHPNQYRGRSNHMRHHIDDTSKIADGVIKAESIATAGAPFGLTEYSAARRYANH